MPGRPFIRPVLLLIASLTTPALANVYSYLNPEGDYVISQKRPEGVAEYAVLTDNGELVELVGYTETSAPRSAIALDVPITHWQPWFLPKQANPFVATKLDDLPVPSVSIEEVAGAPVTRPSTPQATGKGPMIKQIGLLKRRPGMSVEAFREYYETKHRVIGEKYLKGHASKYIRRFLTPVGDPSTGTMSEPEYDVLLEIWYPDQATFEQTSKLLRKPEAAAEIAADEEKLFDRSKMLFFTVQESESDLNN